MSLFAYALFFLAAWYASRMNQASTFWAVASPACGYFAELVSLGMQRGGYRSEREFYAGCVGIAVAAAVLVIQLFVTDSRPRGDEEA